MLLLEMHSTASELAKLAELHALNQLSKSGGVFVPYPRPWRITTLGTWGNQPIRNK